MKMTKIIVASAKFFIASFIYLHIVIARETKNVKKITKEEKCLSC